MHEIILFLIKSDQERLNKLHLNPSQQLEETLACSLLTAKDLQGRIPLHVILLKAILTKNLLSSAAIRRDAKSLGPVERISSSLKRAKAHISQSQTHEQIQIDPSIEDLYKFDYSSIRCTTFAQLSQRLDQQQQSINSLWATVSNFGSTIFEITDLNEESPYSLRCLLNGCLIDYCTGKIECEQWRLYMQKRLEGILQSENKKDRQILPALGLNPLHTVAEAHFRLKLPLSTIENILKIVLSINQEAVFDRDLFGKTFLHYFVCTAQENEMNTVLRHCASISAEFLRKLVRIRDTSGRTAWMIAAERSKLGIMRALLESCKHSASVHDCWMLPGLGGWHASHIICALGEPDLINLLDNSRENTNGREIVEQKIRKRRRFAPKINEILGSSPSHLSCAVRSKKIASVVKTLLMIQQNTLIDEIVNQGPANGLDSEYDLGQGSNQCSSIQLAACIDNLEIFQYLLAEFESSINVEDFIFGSRLIIHKVVRGEILYCSSALLAYVEQQFAKSSLDWSSLEEKFKTPSIAVWRGTIEKRLNRFEHKELKSSVVAKLYSLNTKHPNLLQAAVISGRVEHISRCAKIPGCQPRCIDFSQLCQQLSVCSRLESCVEPFLVYLGELFANLSGIDLLDADIDSIAVGVGSLVQPWIHSNPKVIPNARTLVANIPTIRFNCVKELLAGFISHASTRLLVRLCLSQISVCYNPKPFPLLHSLLLGGFESVAKQLISKLQQGSIDQTNIQQIILDAQENRECALSLAIALGSDSLVDLFLQMCQIDHTLSGVNEFEGLHSSLLTSLLLGHTSVAMALTACNSRIPSTTLRSIIDAKRLKRYFVDRFDAQAHNSLLESSHASFGSSDGFNTINAHKFYAVIRNAHVVAVKFNIDILSAIIYCSAFSECILARLIKIGMVLNSHAIAVSIVNKHFQTARVLLSFVASGNQILGNQDESVYPASNYSFLVKFNIREQYFVPLLTSPLYAAVFVDKLEVMKLMIEKLVSLADKQHAMNALLEPSVVLCELPEQYYKQSNAWYHWPSIQTNILSIMASNYQAIAEEREEAPRSIKPSVFATAILCGRSSIISLCLEYFDESETLTRPLLGLEAYPSTSEESNVEWKPFSLLSLTRLGCYCVQERVLSRVQFDECLHVALFGAIDQDHLNSSPLLQQLELKDLCRLLSLTCAALLFRTASSLTRYLSLHHSSSLTPSNRAIPLRSHIIMCLHTWIYHNCASQVNQLLSVLDTPPETAILHAVSIGRNSAQVITDSSLTRDSELVLRHLLAAREAPNPTIVTALGLTPTLLAARVGWLQALVILAEKYSLNAVDVNGYGILFHASKAGNVQMLEYLLEQPSISSSINSVLKPCLLQAVLCGHEEFAFKLLEYAKSHTSFFSSLENLEDLVIRGFSSGILHISSWRGMKKICSTIANAVSDMGGAGDVLFNTKDDYGLTPITYAFCGGHIELLSSLSCYAFHPSDNNLSVETTFIESNHSKACAFIFAVDDTMVFNRGALNQENELVQKFMVNRFKTLYSRSRESLLPREQKQAIVKQVMKPKEALTANSEEKEDSKKASSGKKRVLTQLFKLKKWINRRNKTFSIVQKYVNDTTNCSIIVFGIIRAINRHAKSNENQNIRDEIEAEYLWNYRDHSFFLRNGFQSLHVACGFGSKALVYSLIEAGADINQEVKDIGTPLTIAAKW